MPEEEGGYTAPATQEALDRIIEQRLSRERAKFADYDTLRDKAAKFDEADAASKSELQRLQEQIAERDATIASLPAKARREAIGFAAAAIRKGFVDAEDAAAFLGDVDLADTDAVEAALEDLAGRKPHLVRTETPPKKVTERPKPKPGEAAAGHSGDESRGKERAVAALRAMRGGTP